MSLDVKGEACGNDFHESMQVNVSQCKSMYDGQDISVSCITTCRGVRYNLIAVFGQVDLRGAAA